MNGKLVLWAEFSVLFFGLPAAYSLGLVPVPRIPVLLGVCLAALYYLLKRSDFCWRCVLHPLSGYGSELMKIGWRSVGVGIFSVAAVMVINPDLLFAFPRTRPGLWLLVMALYPLLSALPQEILYRGFLFKRYSGIFSGRAAMLASVLAFSFLHIVFDNWLAVALTLPAGYIFTRTYLRTGSLMLASLEHAAYGCIVFTTGLGRFFYNPS